MSSERKQRTCLNCGEPIAGEYCAACGQRARIGRLRVRELLRIAAEEVLEFEGPIVRTVVGLTIRPGQVCLDFVEGRRRRYVNPIKYMLVAAALYVFIVRVILHRDLGAGMAKLMGTPTADELTEMNESAQFAIRMSEVLQDSINLIGVALVPIFAALLMVLFWNNGSARRPRDLRDNDRSYRRNYAEHCVYALYMQGHQFMLTLIPSALDANASAISALILQLLLTAYFIWAAVSFYGRGLFATVWRIVVLQIAYFILSGVFGMTIVIVYVVARSLLNNAAPGAV